MSLSILWTSKSSILQRESSHNFLHQKHSVNSLNDLPHLEFSQLQQVLAEGDRRQQRGAPQQQYVALLPLAAAADGVLVAHCRAQAPWSLAGAATDRHSVGSQAAPQRPRVLGRPVTAGLRRLQGARRLLRVTALLCRRRSSSEVSWRRFPSLIYVGFFFFPQQVWGRSRDSPISLRLEKPAVIGACLGDLPRLGALDDQTLHPSPSDFSL